MLVLEAVEAGLADGRELFEMGREEGDDDMLHGRGGFGRHREKVAALEFRRMFNNLRDPCPCFRNPGRRRRHRGAGLGGMLLRMYVRYGERKGFSVEVLEESEGDVAGIKQRHGAAGRRLCLRPPAHRNRYPPPGPQRVPSTRTRAAILRFSVFVIRKSMTRSRSTSTRPTCTDTYRASGAGGQHINKTDSAVRLTHPDQHCGAVPERPFWHRNRDETWKMLRPPLRARIAQTPRPTSSKLEDAKSDIGWGHQIRNCVLDQSRIRISHQLETGNTQAVLDGDLLDDFIAASLGESDP